MTPKEFRAKQIREDRGDSDQWTAADFETYEVLADTTRKHRLALRARALLRTARRRLTRRNVRLAA